MTLKTIVERLARGKVLKRRLPRQFKRIPLYVSPDSQLKYLKPGASAFDLELLQIVQRYIGVNSVLWDISANVGVFANRERQRLAKVKLRITTWPVVDARGSQLLPTDNDY